MKYMLMCLVPVLFFFSLSAEVKVLRNDDKPLNGELIFKLEQEWQVDGNGDEYFAAIRRVMVAEDGTVYIHDKKNLRYYIFGADGQYISAFGKRGEGPGEIRDFLQASHFTPGKKVIARDIERLHYFDSRGKYIKTVINSQDKRPLLFLGEDEYITAPFALREATAKKAYIQRVNTATGAVTKIVDFNPVQETGINTENSNASVHLPAVTPTVIVGHHNDRLFYGMNNRYRINICDMKGTAVGAFSLSRKQRKLTEKVKFDVLWKLGKGRAPKELVQKLAHAMPSRVTHFDRIEVHNGLIYAYLSYYDQKNIQRIDIFSKSGEFLYRASIVIPEGQKLVSNQVLRNGYFYIVIEDEEGEQSVGKYRVELPKN
ncbi:MAG: 6-bladed beta-propeller [bacterium]|nr:6-bladed beta-propeller [bacterium]